MTDGTFERVRPRVMQPWFPAQQKNTLHCNTRRGTYRLALDTVRAHGRYPVDAARLTQEMS